MADLFEVRVDGFDQAELGFPVTGTGCLPRGGSSPPAEPACAAVVEDAISGVDAGRAGGFASVIGLDRSLNPGPLSEHADLVVPDAADLGVVPLERGGHGIEVVSPPLCSVSELPDARQRPRLRPPHRRACPGGVPRLRRHPHPGGFAARGRTHHPRDALHAGGPGPPHARGDRQRP
ncbi:MAG: hypothetical protein R2716_00355 [Microthrixaceae bacterium]